MHDKGAYDNYSEAGTHSSIMNINAEIKNLHEKILEIKMNKDRESPFFVMPKWRKYRLKLRKGVSFEPIIKNPSYPWNYTGSCIDSDMNEYAVIVAYIPNYESILKFWDDPIDVSFEESESVYFDNNFQEPYWYVK